MNYKALIFVLIATFINTSGQLLFKLASRSVTWNPVTWVNMHLILALALYFISALLIVTALKYGELSLVYPLIATGFIWVALLSKIIFDEPLTFGKLSGILLIVFGSCVLNKTPSKLNKIKIAKIKARSDCGR